MATADLADVYRAYIDCLNRQDWDQLDRFVDEGVRHNARQFGLPGYRKMLEQYFEQIPDLRFEIDIIVVDAPHVAVRLWFEVTPKGAFLGLPVNGRTVSFSENAIYAFRGGKIREVWSVIDKAAIEAQLV